MATIARSLLPNHVFGVHGKMRDGVHFVDDTTIVYCAAHCVVWWKTDEKNQKVVCGTADTETMTAIAVSHNRKHVAVAESSLPDRPAVVEPKKEVNDLSKAIELAKAATLEIKGPVISIFDSQTSKKKKVLMGGDIGSRAYISLAFSHDSKCLAAQGGAPDWNLVLWSLEKSKLIASIRTSTGPEVYQVQCCPTDLNLVTVIGDGFAKSFRSTDSALKPISTGIGKREGLKFLTHVWLFDPSAPAEKEKEKGDKEESVCLYALENGEVLYTEAGEIVSSISPPGGLPGAGFIDVILQYSKGFISAERGAIIGIFEKVDDESFKRTRSFKVDANGIRVVSIALSPGEELLICVLESRQIVSVPFQNSEFYKSDEVPKEATGHGFHSEGITGLDVCHRKPLAVTSSTDKYIRVWNYMDKCCELAKYFPQEALSLSLHPSGFHILVGFTDKLRLMNILIDDIRIAKEFNIKSCQDCSFSNGGQYFAAVQQNVIYIFSTYNFENLGNLRAHNGKVRSIWWSPEDTSMLTAGIDGAIYEWHLRDLKRSRENVLKGCIYTSVVGLKDSKSFFAVGSDHKLKELDENSVVKEFFFPILLTQIALPFGSRLLFAGTEFGAVRAYRYPLTVFELGPGEFYEVQAIGSPVIRLVVSRDSSLLLCGGDDGAVAIFDIRDKEKALASHVARHEKDSSHWTSEVLVLKADLEELKSRVQDLETQVTEVQAHCEYQIRLKDEGIALRIKELTDVSDREFAESKVKYEAIIQQKNDKELELEQKYRALEELQSARLVEMEEQYQKKMLVEVSRYTALENEKECQRLEYVEDRALMSEKHEKALVDITDAYEDKLEVQENAYTKLKEEAAQAFLDFEESRHQMEEDIDKEIEDQKEKYDSMIAAEKETVTRLKGENGIMRKKFNEFQKENEEQREELLLLFQQKKELYEIIGSLERDIAGLKKDIQERDDTIGEKERRIYDMKRKNLELEKFKFVLDFKIKDLSEQIEPREAELQDAKDQIRKMEVELERSHAMGAKKDLAVSQLKLKLQGVMNEEEALKRANVLCTTTLKHFQHDYYELAQLITDPEALKAAVISVFRKYVDDKVTPFPIDEELQKDTNRQRDFLERSVAGLRRKLHKEMEAHHTNHLHIMQDNVALIKELNELRRELKIIKVNQQKGALVDGSASQHRASIARKQTALAKGLDEQLTVSQQMEQENLRHRVVQLENELAAKTERIKYLEAMIQELELVQNRPESRGELPPMAGVGTFGRSSTTGSVRSTSSGKKIVQVMIPSSSTSLGRPASSPESSTWSRDKMLFVESV